MNMTRLPRAVNISAASLPMSASLPMAARMALGDFDDYGYNGYAAYGASAAQKQAAADRKAAAAAAKAQKQAIAAQNKAVKQQTKQAQQQAKLQAKQQKAIAKYNTVQTTAAGSLATGATNPIDFANLGTSAVLDNQDWSVTSGSPSMVLPSSGVTDASRLLAPNLPTLPYITKAQIKREKKAMRLQEKAINRLNKLNLVRNKEGASLALGLQSPVDFSNISTGGQLGLDQTVSNPDAAFNPQTGQPLPTGQQPYYPPQSQYQQPGYYPQPQGGYPMPGPTEPMFYPGASPTMYDYPMPQMGGAIFSSQIEGGNYAPQYDPSMGIAGDYPPPWQDSLPFGVPMTENGDLLFMQPDDDPMGEGRTMREAFAGYGEFTKWDDVADPLDSYAAFGADPAPNPGFWAGLTNLVSGGAAAYTNSVTAKQVAKTQAQQQALAQAEAKRKASAGKGISPIVIIGGIGAVGLVIWLATRSRK